MSTLLTPTEFNAESLEEARDIGERVFYNHRLAPVGPHGEIDMQLTAGRLGAATIGYSSYNAEVAVDCIEVDDSYAMCVPVVGGMAIRTSASEVLATPTTAAITGPIRDIHLHGWSATRDPVILLKFERAAVEAELSRMLGRDVSDPVAFAPSLDLSVGAGLRWGQVISLVASELISPQGLFWNPLMAARISTTLLSGLFIAADHQYREALDARGNPSTPATIRRAASYIDDHFHEPITTVSVAAAVGLSVRTLERGFSRYFSTSPRRYIERARLDMVHAELRVGTPERTSVTRVAAQWGFGHLGRFAAIYRDSYGELPSETLRAHPH